MTEQETTRIREATCKLLWAKRPNLDHQVWSRVGVYFVRFVAVCLRDGKALHQVEIHVDLRIDAQELPVSMQVLALVNLMTAGLHYIVGEDPPEPPTGLMDLIEP